jgi:hypothetical protein
MACLLLPFATERTAANNVLFDHSSARARMVAGIVMDASAQFKD